MKKMKENKAIMDDLFDVEGEYVDALWIYNGG
jgi:hypothetical protein